MLNDSPTATISNNYNDDFICSSSSSSINTRKCILITEYNRQLRELRLNASIGSISVLGTMRIIVFILLLLSLILFILFKRSKYLKFNRIGFAFGVLIFSLLVGLNGILLIDLIPSIFIDFNPRAAATNSTTTNGKNSTKTRSSSSFMLSMPTVGVDPLLLIQKFDSLVFNTRTLLATNSTSNQTNVDYSQTNLRTIPLKSRTRAMWIAQPQELLSETICFIHLSTTSLLHWLMILCIPNFIFFNFVIRSYMERKKLRLVKFLEKEQEKIHREYLKRLPEEDSSENYTPTTTSNMIHVGNRAAVRGNNSGANHGLLTADFDRSFISTTENTDSSIILMEQLQLPHSAQQLGNNRTTIHSNQHNQNQHNPHHRESLLFGDSQREHRFMSSVSSEPSFFASISNNNQYQQQPPNNNHHQQQHHMSRLRRDSAASSDTENVETSDSSDPTNLSSFGTSFLKPPSQQHYDHHPPNNNHGRSNHMGGGKDPYNPNYAPHGDSEVSYFSSNTTPRQTMVEDENLESGSVIKHGASYLRNTNGESDTLSQTDSKFLNNFSLTPSRTTPNNDLTATNQSGTAAQQTTSAFSSSTENRQLRSQFENEKMILLLNFIINHPKTFQFLTLSLTTLSWAIVQGIFIVVMIVPQSVTSCDAIWYVVQRVWYSCVLILSAVFLIILFLFDMLVNERNSLLKKSNSTTKGQSNNTKKSNRFAFFKFLANYWLHHDLMWFRREALIFVVIFIVTCLGLTLTDIVVHLLRAEELVIRVYMIKIVSSFLFELPFVLVTPFLVGIFALKRQYHVSKLQNDFVKNQDDYVRQSVRRNEPNVQSSTSTFQHTPDSLIEQHYNLSIYHPTENILRQILKHSKLNRIFQEFLQRELSISNLLLYKAINEYFTMKEKEKILEQRQKLFHIYYNFINSNDQNQSGLSNLLNRSILLVSKSENRWISKSTIKRFDELMKIFNPTVNNSKKEFHIQVGGRHQQSTEVELGNLMIQLKEEILFNLLDVYTRFFIECTEFHSFLAGSSSGGMNGNNSNGGSVAAVVVGTNNNTTFHNASQSTISYQ